MRFEPVINAQVISTAAAAILTVLVAFNVPITDDQRNALLGLVAAVCAIFFGGAVVARSMVYPVDKVDREIIPAAKEAGAQEATRNLVMMGALSNTSFPVPPPPTVSQSTTPPEGDY